MSHTIHVFCVSVNGIIALRATPYLPALNGGVSRRKLMREGKSMSRIAEEAGISKTAIHNYYHSKAKPEGKSLALLSKYFKVEIACLLDEIGGGPLATTFGDCLKIYNTVNTGFDGCF